MKPNDDATQDDKGVSSTEVESADTKSKLIVDTSSFDFVESIAKRNQQVLAQEEIELAKQEGREPAEWTKEVEEEEEKVEEKKEEKIEEKTEEKIEEKKEEKKEDDPLVDIVVDGKPQKVPLSKIIDAGKRTIQKTAAADSRLEEATRLLKEAKEATKLSTTDTKVVDKVSEVDMNKLRADYVHASQYGTEAEAIAALEAWEKAIKDNKAPIPATPVVSVEDIKRVLIQTELERKVYATPELGGFSDLMANPILKDQTGALVDALVKSGKGTYDSFETYKTAGEAVRLIANTLVPEYSLPESVKKEKDSFETKREKKKNIDNLEQTSTKISATEKKDDNKEKPVSEIIAEIKKARGQ